MVQPGVDWVATTFGLEPRWTVDPDIESVARIAPEHLDHGEETQINVSFHAQGAFNKLYKSSAGGSDYLLRVTLPVYPRLKTESEVTTIEFVRENTTIPVPRIFAYNADNRNELRYEWILMEMIPGKPLAKKWRTMLWKAKETIVRQLAAFQAQLFTKQHPRIGNLYEDRQLVNAPESCQAKPKTTALGPLVSLAFFWADHLTYDVPRGPFVNSHEWLQARLKCVLIDQERILHDSIDEDDIEDAGFAKSLAEEILGVLPTVFPPSMIDGNRCILFHDDLSMQNILVDDEGKITAVIGWECVSTLLLWRACQLPQLLQGRTRDERPERSDYGPSLDGEASDADSISSLYWENLLEYEQTELRSIFFEEMALMQPEWVTMLNESTLKADLEQAIHNFDNTWSFKIVKRWLKALTEGRIESLADELR